jgi:hypothetical protein
MGRTSPKKSRKKAPTKSSATRGGGNHSPVAKAARASAKRQVKAPQRDDDEIVADAGNETGAARVFWDKCRRIDRLLGWLATHVNERLKVFSDSAQDANEQGRRKQTSKTAKMTYYTMMADAVFSVDEDETVRADYKQHPERYGKSVENVLGRYVFNLWFEDSLRTPDYLGSESATETQIMFLDRRVQVSELRTSPRAAI